MVQPFLARLPVLHPARIANIPLAFARHKSLTASIERGLRDSHDPFGRPSSSSSSSPRNTRSRESPARSRDSRNPQDRFGRDARSSIGKESKDSFGRESKGGFGRESKYTPGRESKEPFGRTSFSQSGKPQARSDFAKDSRDPFSRNSKDSSGWKPSRSDTRTGDTRARSGGGKDSGYKAREFSGPAGERAPQTHGQRGSDRVPRTYGKDGVPASRPYQGRVDSDTNRFENRYSDRESTRSSNNGSRKDYSRNGVTETTSEPRRIKSQYPVIPFTTAASIFLYGHSVVLAALKARRRKLYNLYIHHRAENRDSTTALIALAKTTGVPVQEVGDDYLNTMDRRAGGRPHNGILLEASELPRPPIAELSKASITDNTFHVELQSQSKEDAQVNGTQNKYTYDSAGWKHPFVLYMDGILDEGNLGAAARSAYFFGVDAIVTPMRSSAPWSQIAIKASSGAAEAIPIFGVTTPVDFLGRSARNGWRIYASDIVPFEPVSVPEASTALSVVKPPEPVTEVVFTHSKSPKRLPIDHCPLKLHPTILMLGSEGEGLRQSLLSAAHFKVGIRAGRDTNIMGVDSLNVSAAASILCYEFSKRPRGAETLGEKVEEKLF